MVKTLKSLSQKTKSVFDSITSLERTRAHCADITGALALMQSEAGGLVKEKLKGISLRAKNGMAIRHVKAQTPELCLAAVENNGLAIQFVKDQTEEICLAAVKQNGKAIQFIATPSVAVIAASENQIKAMQQIEGAALMAGNHSVCAQTRNGMSYFY